MSWLNCNPHVPFAASGFIYNFGSGFVSVFFFLFSNRLAPLTIKV